MKSHLSLGALALALVLQPGLASAKGCLKGAAVGAVGGHVAGHHSVIGAAAGCAVGHQVAKKREAQKTSRPQKTAPPSPAPARS